MVKIKAVPENARSPNPERESRKHMPESPAGSARPLRTLIVDDHPLFRHTLKEALTGRFPFLSIKEAADGQEALEKVETFLPELIFMDINLPDINGLELTRRIREAHPGTTILIITHYNLPEYRSVAQECGARDYITKDAMDPQRIDEVIREVLSGAS
jgi:DNA-binding NarL/FixJ family response regulator